MMNFSKVAKSAWSFTKENKLFLFKLGAMSAIVIMGDTAFASSGDDAFKVVTEPLEKFQKTITGPVAMAVGTAGAGLLGLSVTMNFENQIAKRGIQGVGGVGLGMGAASVVSKLGTAFLI